MNETLSAKWGELRGLKVVSIALGSVTLPDEDAEMIKQAQRTAMLQNPTMAAATMVGAQADAMKAAAANESGAMNGFIGMGMAMNAGGGMNAQNLFAMGAQQEEARRQEEMRRQEEARQQEEMRRQEEVRRQEEARRQEAMRQQMAAAPVQQQSADSWTCSCGYVATGKFCPECGTKRPEKPTGWVCSCGALNKGKFCSECGAKKPTEEPLYRCDKCGWEPEDPKHPPKFCPECGDPFNDADIQS